MRNSDGWLVVDHGSNLGGGRYSITTSNLVAGKVGCFAVSACTNCLPFLGSVVALTLFPALKVVNGNFGKYAIQVLVQNQYL
jgi:hypothetical protein